MNESPRKALKDVVGVAPSHWKAKELADIGMLRAASLPAETYHQCGPRRTARTSGRRRVMSPIGMTEEQTCGMACLEEGGDECCTLIRHPPSLSPRR